MSIRIVRLGTPRHPDEGTRIGIVRRPPRGVPKADYATHDWFDVWYPQLAPTPEQVKQVHTAQHEHDDKLWRDFVRQYKHFLAQPEARHTLEMLAALSHTGQFSIGCYCEDETRCHRSLLRAALRQYGADIVDGIASTPSPTP